MAKIIPFRGFRYNQDKGIDPSAVVTQPYDRIGKNEQSAYYKRHKYNIARIIKGKDSEGDVYENASRCLRQWIDEGVLNQDPQPALYVYHQEYTYANETLTRKGVIALGSLEPDKVHAHEKTLKGPKQDRLNLMRATEANFGHIFMLYSDSERKADKDLQAAIAGKAPTIEAKDDFGNRHLVWAITDKAVITNVQEALIDKDLYIADGHHRYETAVNFMHQCQNNGWNSGAPESFDVRMMTLFNIEEPGMTIRPIHRLIHGVSDFELDKFLEDVKQDFEVKLHSSLEAMKEAVTQDTRAHVFGCYSESTFASFALKDESIMDQLIIDKWSADWKRLDVSILHTAILERHLQIDAQALEDQTNVTYTRDPTNAVEQVDGGKEQIFFYLNPTSPNEVRRVADHGEKMPQKSTDFYPKLLTGLVLSKMEIEK